MEKLSLLGRDVELWGYSEGNFKDMVVLCDSILDYLVNFNGFVGVVHKERNKSWFERRSTSKVNKALRDVYYPARIIFKLDDLVVENKPEYNEHKKIKYSYGFQVVPIPHLTSSSYIEVTRTLDFILKDDSGQIPVYVDISSMRTDHNSKNFANKLQESDIVSAGVSPKLENHLMYPKSEVYVVRNKGVI